MPSAQRSLTGDDVRRYVEQECFAASSGRIGAELEWLTFPKAAPADHAAFETVGSALDGLGALPGGSTVTYEPGGQVELSSRPGGTIDEVCAALSADEDLIRTTLDQRGIGVAGIGLDPVRAHERVVHLPRYAAMEHFFDQSGPEGRRMMCRTAAIQVNVDNVPGAWETAHVAGPTFAAMFANSPFFEGRPTGWQSSRLATWWAIDRSRTAPAKSENPTDAWTTYILGARVMFVRVRDDWYEPLDLAMTFGEWMESGHTQGFPTLDDLRYHATTLFPPVRARGWLELRMIDALPARWWRVAVAVTAAVLTDEIASSRVREACADSAGMWVTASRCALQDRALAASARVAMSSGLEALERMGVSGDLAQLVALFADRYTFRGRSPADDHVEEWLRTGRLPFQAKEPAWT